MCCVYYDLYGLLIAPKYETSMRNIKNELTSLKHNNFFYSITIQTESMRFEDFLRSALSCKSVRSTGRGGGGCINRGQAFIVDEKDHIFVKENDQAKVSLCRQICLAHSSHLVNLCNDFFNFARGKIVKVHLHLQSVLGQSLAPVLRFIK